MVMRISRGVAGSRLGWFDPGRVKFAGTVGLAEACMVLRPRYCHTSRQYSTRNDVDNQNQAEQHQARGPSLSMPVFVRRNGIGVNHYGERSRRLLPAGAPESIPKGSEENGAVSPATRASARRMAVTMPR